MVATGENSHRMLPQPGLQTTQELALHRKPEVDDFLPLTLLSPRCSKGMKGICKQAAQLCGGLAQLVEPQAVDWDGAGLNPVSDPTFIDATARASNHLSGMLKNAGKPSVGLATTFTV